MSSRADVLALVTMLSVGQNDPLMSERFYTEVVIDLAKQKFFVNVESQDVVVGTAVYAYPPNAVDLVRVFFGATQLQSAGLRELEYVDPQWRSAQGDPQAYVLDGETTQTYRLYPVPATPSQIGVPPFAEPFGRGFLDGRITTLYSEQRTVVPDYLDIPIALKIIEREFQRESNHQHMVLAKTAGKLAELLLQMVDPRMP